MVQRVVDERSGRARALRKESNKKKKKRGAGIHGYRLVQPTDVNENKELPPSSDFLSPLSTGKPVGHGTSKAGNTTVAETKRKKRSVIRKRSAVGGCSGGEYEGKGENRRNERILWRLFRRTRDAPLRDYTATGAIISLPRNGSFVKAKPAVPFRSVPHRAAPRRDAAATRVRGGCISVIHELE